MISVFSFSDRRSQLGALVLDVLISEEIDLAAEVTRYPVEDGTTISDHITQGVETVRISGMVSTASVAAFSFSAAPGMVKLVDAVEKLRAMHKARAVVTISTGQMVYKDMAFTSLNAVRTAGERGGNWLSIKGELVKVRKVKLKQAEVPAEPVAEPAKGRAGQTNKPAGKASPTSTTAGATSGAASGAAPVTPAYAIGDKLVQQLGALGVIGP